jgi:hypothetical protein
MINLISTASKTELRAARRNVVLRKYIFTMLALILVITASYAVGYAIMLSQELTYKQDLDQYKPQRAQYADAISKATEYNKNLLIAKSILSNELAFSTFTTIIAQTTPQDVVLSDLNIEIKEMQKPLEFNFDAKSYEKVLATKNPSRIPPTSKIQKFDLLIRWLTQVIRTNLSLLLAFDKDAFNKAQKAGTL